MKITCHYRNDPERGLTDPEVYKQWIDPKEVYPESQAVCFSIRPFANLMKG